MWDQLSLDERKLDILRYIITDYVATAEPVGSRTLARKYGLGVSPATIRNEMADLEAMGLLEQPHTSAGRVPTDQGYRLFVDQIMTSSVPPADQLEQVRALYQQAVREIEGRIRLTAQILSEVTEYFSVVQVPSHTSITLSSLQLMPVRGKQAVLVLVSEEGLVDSRFIELPREMSTDELAKVSQALNNSLQGATVGTLRKSLLRDLRLELAGYRRVLDQVLGLLRNAETQPAEGRIFASGAVNLLRQPEFQDVGRAEQLLSLLAEGQHLLQDLFLSQGQELKAVATRRLGKAPEETQVRVIIGSENSVGGIEDCSVLTASYSLGDGRSGQLAVIGPRRMDYARMVSWVEAVSLILSESLNRSLG